MVLPSADTPLYNHPLPEIEQWLTEKGCERSKQDIHCWLVNRPDWRAELCLDIDQLTVRYFDLTQQDSSPGDLSEPVIQRSFKYSLSRQDIEDAIFAGP
jgi:predicted Fe-S protein YdhL (DUF1289 family)